MSKMRFESLDLNSGNKGLIPSQRHEGHKDE